jgi:hypothetical protein
MICPPLLLKFRMKGKGMWPIYLWLPLFLIWPILFVLVVLISPLILIGLFVLFLLFSVRLNPFTLGWRSYQLLCSLRGLQVDVEEPHQRSRIEICFR